MTEFATLLEALAALISALLWPIIALAALWIFKQEIRELLGRIRRGKLLGQEFELDESLSHLNRSAVAVAAEVAALPQSKSDERGLQTPVDEDVVRRVLDEAARAPKAALLLLASEMERELRELLASLGLLQDKQYVSFPQAIQILQQWADYLRTY